MNTFDFFMTVCFGITIILVICTYISSVKAKKHKKTYLDF